MAILIKNNLPVGECSLENKDFIDDPVSEIGTSIPEIRNSIMDFDTTISNNSDLKVRNMKKATSFPVKDIFALLANNPECKFLRVYNAFTPTGEYITYLAPISSTFDSYVSEDSSDKTIISISCCHCRPCTKDKLLYP